MEKQVIAAVRPAGRKYISSNLECGTTRYDDVYFPQQGGNVVHASSFHVENEAGKDPGYEAKLGGKLLSMSTVPVGTYAHRGQVLGFSSGSDDADEVEIRFYEVDRKKFAERFAGKMLSRWGYVAGNKDAMMCVKAGIEAYLQRQKTLKHRKKTRNRGDGFGIGM